MFSVRRAWPVLAMVLFAACSDSAGSAGDDDQPRPGSDTGVLPEADMGVEPPEPDAGQIVPGRRELKPEEPLNRIVYFGQTADFRVQYVAADGRPIANGSLEASLLDAQTHMPVAGNSVEGSGVRVRSVRTDAMGWATFQVQAGNLATQFELQVAADGAEAVFWRVSVQREGTGGVRVKVTYDDQTGRYAYGQFQRVDVSLFNGGESCVTLRQSATMLSNAYLAVPIQPFDPTHNEILVDDLDDSARFAMAAQVFGTHGGVVAFGCTEGVTVEGGTVKTITIQANDLPLNFKGRFRTVNKLQMTDLLENSGNSIAETAARVLDILRVLGGGEVEGEDSRGEALIDLICGFATDNEGLCDIISRLGAPLIERAIENFVPPEVLRILNIIGDVISIAETMTVVGEIEFTQSVPDENNMLSGNDNRWQKFRFTWRNGCPMNDPGMCQREFTIGDLDVDRRPIAGVFNGRLEGLDLNIDSHGLNVKYGVILLGIAETWVIPAILGQPIGQRIGLDEVLATLLPCEDINDFFGDPQSGLCEDVLVAALTEILIEQLVQLDVDVDQFQLRGTVQPLDTDGDLAIDTLSNGIWNGSIDFGGEMPIPFDGCFNGCRDQECAEECSLAP